MVMKRDAIGRNLPVVPLERLGGGRVGIQAIKGAKGDKGGAAPKLSLVPASKTASRRSAGTSVVAALRSSFSSLSDTAQKSVEDANQKNRERLGGIIRDTILNVEKPTALDTSASGTGAPAQLFQGIGGPPIEQVVGNPLDPTGRSGLVTSQGDSGERSFPLLNNRVAILVAVLAGAWLLSRRGG